MYLGIEEKEFVDVMSAKLWLQKNHPFVQLISMDDGAYIRSFEMSSRIPRPKVKVRYRVYKRDFE